MIEPVSKLLDSQLEAAETTDELLRVIALILLDLLRWQEAAG